MPEPLYFIVDLRPEFSRRPYVTLWRPNNANYAYPLPWAGRYDKSTIDAAPGYYAKKVGGRYTRFPVPIEVVERLTTAQPGRCQIDGNVGPVIPNDAKTRQALRQAKYVPPFPAESER